VWTVGGVVLTACSGGTRIVEGDGVGGGASAVPVKRGVFDGAVSGARIYVDVNGDGEIDEGDAGPYVTDGSGFADIPWAYRGYSIIADVSRATDVETGEVLSGEFRSLVPSDPGGVLIATPLTDLLSGAEDKQGILDTIFGAGVVTVKEVEDPGYYRLVEPGESLAAPTAPTAPGEGATAEALAEYEAEQARYEAEQAAYVSQQITRASIALTELKADAAAAGGADISTSAGLAVVIRDALKAKDPNNPNSLDGLRDRIAAREDEAGLIAGGKPIASGGTVRIEEDGAFRIADHVMDPDSGEISADRVDAFFGFLDPGGNSDIAGTPRSLLHALLVKVSPDNGTIYVGDKVLVAGGAPAGADPALTAALGPGYAYVSFNMLSGLRVKPDADYNGDLTLRYRVWDGEDVSDEAVITITVDAVEDAAKSILLDNTAIPGAGGLVGTETVFDPDGDVYSLNEVRLEAGDDAGLFELVEVGGAIRLNFIGDNPGVKPQYVITLTATDPDNPDLVYSQDVTLTSGGRLFITSAGVQHETGATLLAENADGSSSAIAIGVLSHEGGNTGFDLAKGEDGSFLADNADFEIKDVTTGTAPNVVTNPTLFYKGSASGDFEAGDTLTIQVTSSNTSGESVTQSFVLHLSDVDDLPVFDVPSYAFTLNENADGSTTAVAVGTVSATDQDAGDHPLSCRFAIGTHESGDFRLDATSGVITYVGAAKDFEGGAASYNLTVEAVPASGGGSASSVAVTVTVGDVDEAPTGISLDRVVLLPAGGRVGAVTVSDPDAADGNGADYKAGDITIGGADAAFFTMSDAGGEAVLSFVSGQTPAKTSYDITLTASDPDNGTLTHSEAFTITVQRIFVLSEDGQTLQSSGYTDGNGNGILAEHADGSSTREEIGVLGHDNGNSDFVLSSPALGNDNTQFSITSATSGGVTTYTLNFTGSDSGDFEADDTLTVSITSTDDTGGNVVTDNYLIRLADIDDAPQIIATDGAGGSAADTFTVKENIAAGTTIFQISVEDDDVIAGSQAQGSIVYGLVAGSADESVFAIDSATGEVSFRASPDYETPAGGKTTYSVEVIATITRGTGAQSVSETAETTITVALEDVDEGPTDISLSNITFRSSGGLVGTVTVTDPEGDSYTDSEVVSSDTTNFEVRTNAGTGELELHYIGTTPATQRNYSITLTATDSDTPSGTPTFSRVFDLELTGLHITTGGETLYSGNLLASGDALLDEHADGSSTAIVIGTLGHDNGNTAFEFTGSGNNNDLFNITSATSGGVTTYTLTYTGADAGDFEAGEKMLVVEIESKNAAGANATTESFVFHLNNLDDNTPEFEPITLAGGITEDTVNGNILVPEALATGTPVFTVRATDADNAAEDPNNPVDIITYILAEASDNFSVDATTGVVTLIKALDFETIAKDGSGKAVVQVKISAVSTSSLSGNSYTTFPPEIFNIEVMDVNEGPTGINLSNTAFNRISEPDGLVIAELSVDDPEGDNTYSKGIPEEDNTYSDENFILGGEDARFFRIVDSTDTTNRFLPIKGPINLVYAGDAASLKETYSIEITATDADAEASPSHTQSFTIQSQGLFLDLPEVLSGTEDARILLENADGTSGRLEIGTLGHQNSDYTRFLLPTDVGDNDQFEIENGKLYYKGADSGDYEAGDTLTVRIASSKADQTGEFTEDYVIIIGNVNEHSPEIDPVTSVRVLSGADISDPVLTLNARDPDHLTVADKTDDPLELILPAGFADNDKFEIDATGTVTVKSGEITSYNFGDEYKLAVLASSTLGLDIDDVTYPLPLDTKLRVETNRDDLPFAFVHGLVFRATEDFSDFDPGDQAIQFNSTSITSSYSVTLAGGGCLSPVKLCHNLIETEDRNYG